ncbi:hypothetical protein [Pseudonocardia sp. Ae150A_Ps1]|uniref:hypothetical protein n=1 Tax=unclassified Pseudonocardia TaxID=2619320 RepID=UPI0032C41BB7
MPITGVMPLPAVTNSSGPDASAGRVKSPVACSSSTIVPIGRSRTSRVETTPSGTSWTVIVRWSASSGEVSE